jgi:3-oxoacyl-[acyl-carrier-protein] synthase-1
LFLHDLGIVSALGCGKTAVLSAWLSGQYPKPESIPWLNSNIPALSVTGELPSIPKEFKDYDCRTNRLLLAALQQIESSVHALRQRYRSDRIGLILGTSTSGIAEGEAAEAVFHTTGAMPADYHYKQQELGGVSEFLSRYLDIQGPAFTVASTCSSSANALISARRLLRLGICDALVVGGCDSLCNTTLKGFSALDAVSRSGCNPFSKNRDGIIIGEGAALLIMTNEPAAIGLLGAGVSSDAYHICAPHPDGTGAYMAMQTALDDAGLSPEQIGYINLHGTATLQNDAMESKAVNRLFGSQTPCSSSKPATGHCLGASGAIEAGLCWLLLSELNTENYLPPHLWDGEIDPELVSLCFTKIDNRSHKPLQYCLSNSFAFGGNNVSLLIGHT